jgi:hypothetical protein
MRLQFSISLEDGRVRTGHFASRSGRSHGAFHLQGPCGCELAIISSGTDAETGWEHVSVSTNRRIPNWTEMCFVKDLFWDEEEAVMQLHPPKSSYVNVHPYCLHLWRPTGDAGCIPLPDPVLVGPKVEDDDA